MKNNNKNQIVNNLKETIDLSVLVEACGQDRAALCVQVARMIAERPENAAQAMAELLLSMETLKAEVEVLQAQVYKDSLTGVFNKNYLMTHLAQMSGPVASERRKPHGDHILMIDLDGFKPINDLFGHAAGDVALKRVADALIDRTRETDIVARLGGDEFLVFLRGADDGDAQRKADEIRNDLSSLTFKWQEKTLPVRGSVGTSQYDPSLSPVQNLHIADQRMYEIKRAKGDTRHQILPGMMKPAP
jgi:diguanylate cyclase (GGDEF)-like protein